MHQFRPTVEVSTQCCNMTQHRCQLPVPTKQCSNENKHPEYILSILYPSMPQPICQLQLVGTSCFSVCGSQLCNWLSTSDCQHHCLETSILSFIFQVYRHTSLAWPTLIWTDTFCLDQAWLQLSFGVPSDEAQDSGTIEVEWKLCNGQPCFQ